MKAEMKTILDYLEHNLNVSHAPKNKTMSKVVALDALTALIIKWLEGKKRNWMDNLPKDNDLYSLEKIKNRTDGRNQLITELIGEMRNG